MSGHLPRDGERGTENKAPHVTTTCWRNQGYVTVAEEGTRGVTAGCEAGHRIACAISQNRPPGRNMMVATNGCAAGLTGE